MEPILLTHQTLFGLAAFIVGACVGSFLNVCIYRIPLNRSVVTPGSHCAACGAPIAWHHNLPIVSWLVLRGRAACCGTRIDVRYCVVETVTAFLFLALWLRYGAVDPVAAVLYAVFVAGLIAASLIDFDHFIIPDRFTLGGCVAGFVACAIHPALLDQVTPMAGLSWSLASAVIGALSLLTLAWVGTLLFKKEAMGLGDVKFLAAMCAFLGAASIVWIVALSALIGSILGIALIFWRNAAWGTRIPYGPFLALAAVLWLFGGREIWTTYWDHVMHLWHVTMSPMIDARTLVPGP